MRKYLLSEETSIEIRMALMHWVRYCKYKREENERLIKNGSESFKEYMDMLARNESEALRAMEEFKREDEKQ